MASKRVIKSSKITKLKDYNNLVLNDVLCPICRTILIEPVTLPCTHNFCLYCFEGTMENANLVCPLCRLRIGSWLRRVRKDNMLIDMDLWKAVREKFPQSVNNKLNDIDENIEEKREIIVSYPGEIRKEYELQKRKDDEEISKKREAELQASEELIRKLKEEEEQRKAALAEKIRLDEEIAKKLAQEIDLKSPSTSKMSTSSKKHGPMDKFVKKEIDNSNSFINKEYTCRVLCLDNNRQSSDMSCSPKIHKKVQRLQKRPDIEGASDGSDCIESEMRYFKPIDYMFNLPSQRKTPFKVVPRKLSTNTSAKVMSPSGLVNFYSNVLESAFARFSEKIPSSSSVSTSTPTSSRSSVSARSSIKRRITSPQNYLTPDKKMKSDLSHSDDTSKISPTLNCDLPAAARKRLFGDLLDLSGRSVESPSFRGFDNKTVNNNNIIKPVKKNGSLVESPKKVRDLKKLQEEADLEFAKRLQEEINRSHYTRSFPKRQKTLDEMMMSPYRVK